MGVKRFLKRSEALVGAVRDCRRLLASARAAERWGPNNIAKRYLESARVKKLELGAGPTALRGWLGTDITPINKDTMYLDATKPFPFADGTFDYVYSEHMIEHIPWRDGLAMLKECHRVLKPTGTLRVATPDMTVMVGLLTNRTEVARRYISWITNRFLEDAPTHSAAFVINCAFNNWGHEFLYDAETLELTMRLAGFTSTRRHAPGESEDPNLANLESHGANVGEREMADFETMVLEARRS